MNDIIGFNINADDDKKFVKLNDRDQATNAYIRKFTLGTLRKIK